MKTSQTLTLTIDAPDPVGPVIVFLQPFSESKGRITIVNLGDAWTAFWGAMPQPLAAFFAEGPDDYLVSKLHQRPITRHETARLKRVIEVVRLALENHVAEGQTATPEPCPVPGCVRVAGHPNFHCTSDQIAKREDSAC